MFVMMNELDIPCNTRYYYQIKHNIDCKVTYISKNWTTHVTNWAQLKIARTQNLGLGSWKHQKSYLIWHLKLGMKEFYFNKCSNDLYKHYVSGMG